VLEFPSQQLELVEKLSGMPDPAVLERAEGHGLAMGFVKQPLEALALLIEGAGHGTRF
jgi:hypothetical protein